MVTGRPADLQNTSGKNQPNLELLELLGNTTTVKQKPQIAVVYYFRGGWRGSVTVERRGLVISRSRVRILLETMLRNNLGQVVYTYVPLLPSSITWYRPKGGDALRPGR